MLITYEIMRQINEVQIEILRAVSEVCAELNIPFYMVHGSLLGTIRNHEFVLGDDDIDIALLRGDYELFMKKAPEMMGEGFFVQTNQTDPEYPLSFGKIRDSRTTYVVEGSEHLKINHGIYIDVFPIDYCAKSKVRRKCEALVLKVLNYRIASVYRLNSQSTLKKIVRFCTRVCIPSLNAAVRMRESLLISNPVGEYIRVTGGKTQEQMIPAVWFSTAVKDMFEGVYVYIPGGYDRYLTQIYGDYRNRTLIENKISDACNIEVNASIVDTVTPYTEML